MLKQFKINPTESKLMIFTQTGGLLGKMGHDLTIRAKIFSGIITLDLEDIHRSKVRAEVLANSLEVQNSLPPKDLKEINAHMFGDVLELDHFPRISFESTLIRFKEKGEGNFWIEAEGLMTLKRVSKKSLIQAQVFQKNSRLEAKGEFFLKQTDFKIQPFSALAGTLKVKNKLRLSFSIVSEEQKLA